MKNTFSDNFKIFSTEFKEEFQDFIEAQCSICNYSLSIQECEELAQNILNNITKEDIEAQAKSVETYLKVTDKYYTPSLFFNKSLMHILEKYSIFLHLNPTNNFEYLSACIRSFNRFSCSFEKILKEKIQKKNSEVSFSENNVIVSKNNIVEILSRMKNENKTVKFMNLYQGVPISYEGEILNIDDKNVVFKVTNESQEIAMKLDGKAHILQNDYLQRYIRADVIDSNFNDHTVTLNNFVFLLNMPAMMREFIRVYPDKFSQVSLYNAKNKETIGNLYDISLSGIGLVSGDDARVSIGEKIIVKFELGSDKEREKMSIEGEIVNVIKYENSYRYCLRIFPNQDDLAKTSAYITKRKGDILKELEEEFKKYRF